MFSYLVLGCLALVVGFFIFSEIRVFLSTKVSEENDAKLLRTGSLLTELYEAESLSKLALQTKTKRNFRAYSRKIDSVLEQIEILKQLTGSEQQIRLLDSVGILLKEKVSNGNQLLDLKIKTAPGSSIDDALEELNKMEASFGKLTIENFNKDPDKLEPYKRKILEDWVAYLNQNIPDNTSDMSEVNKIDSVLSASKSILDKAKASDTKTQKSLARKETALNQNDMELSQQLRGIITAFEGEIMINTYNDNLKRQTAFRRSIRLAGFAALLGFVIVAFFTFLITRDYWRVQTYRQKLEKEKKYSESLLKSREQLISTVGHDLRTPLNSITGYAELMENTSLTNTQIGYLDKVRSASLYVDRLMNDLLDFSKLEAGKIKTEKTAFKLSELLQDTAENLEAIHRQKKLDLIINIDPQLDHAILGDPLRVRQILTNLLANAYKFTHEGFIKIKAQQKVDAHGKDIVVIRVIDSGIGIKKEKQEHIFNEFTQAGDNTERQYGGYGLGLTISKKLANLLGGSISVESEEQKGSVFSLTLPLKFSDKPLKTPKRTSTYSLKDLSILILDDDPGMLQLLKEVCQSLQLSAHIFNDFNIITHSMKLSYDVVLTDIQMPSTDGFKVLEALKSGKYHHYTDQPVIAMTGRKDLEQEVYLSSGFSGVLQKPFTRAAFVQKLGHLFPKVVLHTSVVQPSVDEQSNSSLFNLRSISSFLGTDREALHDVLHTLIADTTKNMDALNESIVVGNYKEVKAIAHRMLPMLRQLEANEIVPMLETLEQLDAISADPKKLKTDFTALKHRVTALILAMNAYLSRSPSYSD